jgi:hypothetical protein
MMVYKTGTLLDTIIGHRLQRFTRDLVNKSLSEIIPLEITTNKGVLYCYPEADCCSETWWSEVIITDNDGYNGKDEDWEYGNGTFKQDCPSYKNYDEEIIGLFCPDFSNYNLNDGRSRQEYDQIYGFIIRTTERDIQFNYRNSSNGYYGGWLSYKWEPLNAS